MTGYLKLAQHKNTAADYQRAKKFRQNPAPAEKIAWFALREYSRSSGFKFRRQFPIHPYIVDFICLSKKLIIEIDGWSHDTRQAEDARRDHFLRNRGYDVNQCFQQKTGKPFLCSISMLCRCISCSITSCVSTKS